MSLPKHLQQRPPMVDTTRPPLERTHFGARGPRGGRWAITARCLWESADVPTLSLCMRLDIAGGRLPMLGTPAIVHRVPAHEMHTLAAALTELAELVATTLQQETAE